MTERTTLRTRRKILVIDDDSQLRDIIEMALKADYDVKSAEDGQEGIAVAKKEVPDLILCDVMLPRMTGSEVLRHLQRDPALYYIPVVMMTAAALDPVTVSMFQQHPNCRQWLRKPFGMDALTKTVSEVLSSKAAPPPKPAAADSKRRFKIMIVEDEVNFFEFLNLSMRTEDVLMRASDGQDALNQIDKFGPDLVLADMRMPRMSGDQLLQALYKNPKYQKIPVLLMTAYPLTPAQKETLFKNFSNLKGLLEKPFDDAALRKMIDTVLVRDLVS